MDKNFIKEKEKEQLTAKKDDIKLSRDRGDNVKKFKEPLNSQKPKSVEIKIYFPDRGDLRRKSSKRTINKFSNFTEADNTSVISENFMTNVAITDKKSAINDINNSHDRKTTINIEKTYNKDQNLARTRSIYGESLLNGCKQRNVSSKALSMQKSDFINVPLKKPPQPVKEVQISKKSNRSTSTDEDNIHTCDKKMQIRKHVARTTGCKENTKICKAVSFVNQKETKYLDMKFPNEVSNIKTKRKANEIINTKLKSSSKIFEPNFNKKIYTSGSRPTREKKNKPSSTSHSFDEGYSSPTTESVKWDQSSIDSHARPYYEAWINTTLAAISKVSQKDELYRIKQNIIQNFQRSLEESIDSTEYDNTDEKFTGRIKITQKRNRR